MESLIHQKTLSTCVFGGKKFNWSFPVIFISRKHSRTPMVVQWLGLYTSTAKGVGSIPGWGTKIPCAVGSQKKKKRKKERKKERKQAYVLSAMLFPPGGFLLGILKYLNFCATHISYMSFWTRPNSSPIKLLTLNRTELINKGIESCINTVQVEGQFKMETRKHLKCS